jgi:hypothetical protein
MDSDDEVFDPFCAICGGPFRGLAFKDRWPNSPPDIAGYDPDILSPEETAWTLEMYVAGRAKSECVRCFEFVRQKKVQRH